MFKEKTTFAEKFIELRNKKAEQQAVQDTSNNIHQGMVVMNQRIYEIEEKEIADGRISMHMPSEFEPLEDNLAEAKYPHFMCPQYIYSDKTTSVTMTFTFDDKTMEEDEIHELKEQLIYILSDLHPECEILDDEMLQAEELDIELFSFAKPVMDGELYQLFSLMRWNEKLLLGGFNCDMQVKDSWYPVICQMLQTIRLINKDENIGEEI
ncbi:hypothetical protein [Anaerosporobacter sp.]|uniref:hypothetical protein n=1 Tax=Anaerosporobacter sp. TaxID=1872529 RepID=UPI00286F4890|nr:hypothetical protein [Anaerosporobacter sp.]